MAQIITYPGYEFGAAGRDGERGAILAGMCLVALSGGLMGALGGLTIGLLF